MAKKNLVITVDGQTIKAPIWEEGDMSWQDRTLGCPYCGIFSPVKPVVDTIQYGLTGEDSVHTVCECGYCSKYFALHYVTTVRVGK